MRVTECEPVYNKYATLVTLRIVLNSRHWLAARFAALSAPELSTRFAHRPATSAHFSTAMSATRQITLNSTQQANWETSRCGF